MRILISLIIVLTGSTLCYGQIQFFNLYTNNGSDQGQDIVQLEDSSYVITGSSSSFSGSAQAFLMKIDSLGNYIWSNHYGGAESESGRRVLYKEDFGFFICGYTNSFGTGDFDYYLVKVDEDGLIEWERSYGGTGWERVHDAALTRDTGTIMVGETSSNETDNQNIYIVRTDIDGDTLWTKTFGGPGPDFATCIKAYDDSTFVIGGHTYIEDSLMTKGFLLFLHEDGTVYWQDTVGNTGDHWINDFVFDGPSSLLGVGGAEGDGMDGIDPYYFIHYMNNVHGGGYHIVAEGDADNISITQHGVDDDYYIGLHVVTSLTYPVGNDINITKQLQAGFIWDGTYALGYENPDVIGNLIRTSDGGAVMVGYTTGVISGGNEIFVYKIGPNDGFPAMGDSSVNNVVALNEVEFLNDVVVYPNPSNNVVNISTENGNYSYFRLYNSLGQVVATETFSMKSKIDVSRFNSGMYVLEIGGENLTPVRSQIRVVR